MKWKSALGIFVILSIGSLLLRTEGGQQYFDQSMTFLKVGVGNVVASTFGPKMPKGEPFTIDLTAQRESFSGQSYNLQNSIMNIAGVCVDMMKIDSVQIHKGLLECKIISADVKGTLHYTESGTVEFSGTTSEVEVDGETYTSLSVGTNVEKPLKISFEIIPKNAVLSDIIQPKVSFESVDGVIEKFNPDGSVKSIEELLHERLEIRGFEGYLRIENSNIIRLEGTAVSVKGTGDYSSFSW